MANGSNFGECVARVAETGVGQERAEEILQQVHDRGEGYARSGSDNPYRSAAGKMASEAKDEADLAKLDALRMAKARTDVMNEVRQKGGIAKALETMRSILHGTNTGGRDSIESIGHGNANAWQGVLSFKIRQSGLEKAMISGEIDPALSRIIWELNEAKRAAGPDAKPTPPSGKGGTPMSRMAQDIVSMLDNVRSRLNAAGAHIANAFDYVTHTLHDPVKIRGAAGPGASLDESFKAYWGVVEPLLGERSFEHLVPAEGESMATARERFGRGVFNAFVSGVHLTSDGAFGLPVDEKGFVPETFQGTANVAKKLSQPRVLHFRDGEAWAAYMKQFGRTKSLGAGLMMSLEQSGMNLALLQRLGPNPTANFNEIIKRIGEEYRDQDPDAVAAFKQKTSSLDNVMAQLDGRARIPHNQMWARLNAGARTVLSTGSLGSVGVTHGASIWVTVPSELVHHDVSRITAMGAMVQGLFKGKGSVERQEVMAQLGAWGRGLAGDMLARWQPDDNIPGRLSSMANTFMKWSGLHYIFDNTQASMQEVLANQLARGMGGSLRDIGPHVEQMLGKYGIGPKEWDLLRSVSDVPHADGMGYLTPNLAMNIDPALVRAHLAEKGSLVPGMDEEAIQRAVDAQRYDLQDRLLAYYRDAAAHGVVTPGARERAMALGGARAGSFSGELARYAMQFKMWPLAAMHQLLARDIYMSLNKTEAAWNVGTMLSIATLAGLTRMMINDAALGHPIRNPLDMSRDKDKYGHPTGLPHGVNTLLAALAQGGGVGIMGDFLFGEVNRFGGGLIGTLGGPAAGDADQLVKLYGDWRKGDAGWPDLAHFAVRHVPFANLVYLKGAFDYLLWYHLYEAASPGWWERTNRRMIREQGRPAAGYIPGAGVPFTPWGTPRAEPGRPWTPQ